jgi:replication factor C subunit 3/5
VPIVSLCLRFLGRVNLHPSGLAALLKLSKGDMRRALNVLQVSGFFSRFSHPLPIFPSCFTFHHLAVTPLEADRSSTDLVQACHAAFDIVDETAVYACTGNPHPDDVRRVIESMMGEEFTTSYECPFSFPSCPLSLSLACWNQKLTPSLSLSLALLMRISPVVSALKADKGLALQDLVVGAYEYVQSLELSDVARIYLLDQLAQAECAPSFPLYFALAFSLSISLPPSPLSFFIDQQVDL